MIAVVASTLVASSDTSGITTGSLNTTGADLIVLCVGYYSGGGGTATVSDSKGNTWTGLTARTGGSGTGSDETSRIFYCSNPTVGTGHTFTVTSVTAATYPTIGALAVSGAKTASSPFDVENGAGSVDVTIQPGSITPAVHGSLVFSSINSGSGGDVTGNSGLTVLSVPASGSIGGGFGYKVQNPAAAINPTWNFAFAYNASAIAAFAPAVAATPPGGGGGLLLGL